MTDKEKLTKTFNDLNITYYEMGRILRTEEGEVATKCVCVGNPEKDHVTFNFDLISGEYLSLGIWSKQG